MINKKIKLTKKAWQEAGIKRGLLVKKEDNETLINKEAFAPLAVGALGAGVGMAGNWLWDKAKQGDWLNRITGYDIPQDKIEEIKKVLQDSTPTLNLLKSVSPEMSAMIDQFNEQVNSSIQRAEAENANKGVGSEMYQSSSEAAKKWQEQQRMKQESGISQNPQQAANEQKTQQIKQAPQGNPSAGQSESQD